MWQKISNFPLAVHFTFTRFLQELKEDERGLSGVVVAVLLVLVAVLAIILLWGLLSEQIKAWWDNIIGKSGEIT